MYTKTHFHIHIKKIYTKTLKTIQMGEYKFSIYAKWSFGFNLSYEYGQILLRVPFLVIHFSLSKYATGYCLFDKWIK
jgi:hypothetical protein